MEGELWWSQARFLAPNLDGRPASGSGIIDGLAWEHLTDAEKDEVCKMAADCEGT